MARTQKPHESAKKLSHKAANAAGYASRQSRKSKLTSATGISDVYEYQQQKVRRAKVKLQYEDDELIGATGGGRSDSEDEDGGRPRIKPRLIGEGEEDERIRDDEDEEIDSDAAFEESDEERFAGFNFSTKRKAPKKSTAKKGSTTGSVHFVQIDLNEDDDDYRKDGQSASEGESSNHEDEEDDEEEGEPGDFFDVLDILDGRGKLNTGDELGGAGQETEVIRGQVKDARHAPWGSSKAEHEHEMMEDGFEDEDENEDDAEESEASMGEDEEAQEGISGSEAEGEGEIALQDLERFVTSLDAGQKRKVPDGEVAEGENAGDAGRARKRRLLKERTEAGEENEFAAHVGGAKLKIDDLLAPLASQSSNLLSLKKSAKVLASQVGTVKTLSAPLPQRTAERLDREAAYEQTREEVEKWNATMQRIKGAEHLSFPLQAPSSSKTSNLELAAKFKPTTELESAVDKLLKSAKMRDEDIVQTESLKLNHLSVEEIATRRAELAKMRDLTFRADAKAKRVAKIKSKTYRRLKKKEKAKLAAKLGEGEEAEDEDDEESRMKREVERARERATLRHKNTGKWAQAMKARGELDEDQRREISEMLDRGEKLRRKIRGDRGSDEEDSEEDESDEENSEGAVQRIKANAFEELAALNNDIAGAPAESEKLGKSIFEMKFMKDAMARDQRRVDDMVDDFVKEMGGPVLDEEGDILAGDDVEEERPYATTVQRVGGRATYRPGVQPDGPLTSLESDTSSVTLKSTDMPGPTQPDSSWPTSPVTESNDHAPPLPEVNPWLAKAEEQGKPVQKRHEVTIGKNSGGAEKSKNKLRKKTNRLQQEKEKTREEATVDISMSNVMTLASSVNSAASSSKEASLRASATVREPVSSSSRQGGDDSDSEAHSEVEEQEKLLDPKGKRKAQGGIKAFEQRDLVALAFAGDNVVQEFTEQKRRAVQEDAPKEVDTTLPGWGSWGGKGTKKAAPKPFLIKKVAGIDPSSRADYKKAHVIISEKRDKKAAKYLVKDLPYPYTSKSQFEHSLDTPIGIEWNTRVGFQRATLPRVVKKPGTIISPLEKLV